MITGVALIAPRPPSRSDDPVSNGRWFKQLHPSNHTSRKAGRPRWGGCALGQKEGQGQSSARRSVPDRRALNDPPGRRLGSSPPGSKWRRPSGETPCPTSPRRGPRRTRGGQRGAARQRGRCPRRRTRGASSNHLCELRLRLRTRRPSASPPHWRPLTAPSTAERPPSPGADRRCRWQTPLARLPWVPAE